MSRIKSGDTKPELALRRALWSKGARYRVRMKVGGARPDIVFLGAQLAVFVDGCFWHGCPDHFVHPRTRVEYWANKIRGNVERDVRQTAHIANCGWRVVRIWAHQIVDDPVSAADAVISACRGAELETRHWRVYRVEPADDDWNLERRYLVDVFNGRLRREVVRRRSLSSRCDIAAESAIEYEVACAAEGLVGSVNRPGSLFQAGGDE